MYWSLCYKLYASKNSKKLKLPLLPEFDGYQPDAAKVHRVQLWSQNWVAILPILPCRQWTPPWHALVMVDNSLPFFPLTLPCSLTLEPMAAAINPQSNWLAWLICKGHYQGAGKTYTTCILSMWNNDWGNDAILIITLHFLWYNTAFIPKDRRRIKSIECFDTCIEY